MKITIQGDRVEVHNIPALVVILIVVIVGGYVLKISVLGGANAVQLRPAVGFSGVISQSLASSNSKTALPSYGMDYTLTNTAYFDNNAWVITSIVPQDTTSNQSIAILHKNQGIFRVILGPGTAFASTELGGLPNDVVDYLHKLGVVYEPAN